MYNALTILKLTKQKQTENNVEKNAIFHAHTTQTIPKSHTQKIKIETH